MERVKRAPRRKHSKDLRSRVLAECAQPGASVAAVAMAHGLNANLVRKWRHTTADGSVPAVLSQANKTSGEFVALALPSQGGVMPLGDIRIELRRGATAMSIHWPVQCAGECAAWLREWLK
jgi:transposase